MFKTGLNILAYTSQKELMNAQNGASTLIAFKTKIGESDYQIYVPLDACDILGNEIRVNLSLIRQNVEDVGRVMGDAIGKELEKVFNKFV